MRHHFPAQITPRVLSWAIQRAETPHSTLAKAIGVKPNAIEGWIGGKAQPTFRQARKAAEALRIPFGYLYLSEPPKDTLPIPDLRRVHGQPAGKISLNLRDTISITLRKQTWLAETLRESGAEPIPFVGKAKHINSIVAVAKDIREVFALENPIERPSRADGFMRQLILQAEKNGVSVLKSGVVGNNNTRKLDIKEFRGFAISDEYAPFVFVNSRDIPEAQIFTLMHEMVHIWRGDSGISGSITQTDNTIERFCNQVAAEVLVPTIDFDKVWDNSVNAKEMIIQLTKYFHVSRYVIAIRAYENGKISKVTLNRIIEAYRREIFSKKKSSGGGQYYATLISRNSRNFTANVIDSLASQSLLIRDAAALLDTQPNKLSKIATELHKGE